MEENDSKIRKELDMLDIRYFNSYLNENEQKEELEKILTDTVEWLDKNPDHLQYFLEIARGSPSSMRHLTGSGNPVFYRALGKSSNPAITKALEVELERCNQKGSHCFHVKEMFLALLELGSQDAISAIERLFKKPQKNRLSRWFIDALYEIPKPACIPVLKKIASTGNTYMIDQILAKMNQMEDIPMADLLSDSSKYIRQLAVDTLSLQDIDKIQKPVLDRLNRMVENEKEDLLIRIQSAEILKKRDLPVPPRFRDRLPTRTTDNLSRLIIGIIKPEEKDVDWAQEEIVRLDKYKNDDYRVVFRYSFGTLFADVKIWRGCFWDVFNMGVYIRKNLYPRGSYKVVGLTRATRFETKAITEKELVEDLDKILIGIARKQAKSEGERYEHYIRTVNRAIREGRELMIYGRPTWELDKEKIRKQGGC